MREINYLEKNSCVSVNVYGYDKIPYPYYICRAHQDGGSSQGGTRHSMPPARRQGSFNFDDQ